MRIYTSSGKQFFEATDLFTGDIVTVSLDDIVYFSYEYCDDTGFSTALCLFSRNIYYFIFGSLSDVEQCFRNAGVFYYYKHLFYIL